MFVITHTFYLEELCLTCLTAFMALVSQFIVLAFIRLSTNVSFLLIHTGKQANSAIKNALISYSSGTNGRLQNTFMY